MPDSVNSVTVRVQFRGSEPSSLPVKCVAQTESRPPPLTWSADAKSFWRSAKNTKNIHVIQCVTKKSTVLLFVVGLPTAVI